MNNTYWLFVLMVIFTVASPGPGVLMTLDNAIAGGWKASMHGVLGLAIGAAVMAGLSSAGIGLLVRSSPTLFTVLKYCGVTYLFYLSYKTWNREPNSMKRSNEKIVTGEIERQETIGVERSNYAPFDKGRLQRLSRGALLQTSNPKSLLFFLSVLPQVAEGSSGSIDQSIRLAFAIATYCVALILVHALYAGLAVKVRIWLSKPNTARMLSRLSAIAFLLFGLTMLTLKI